MKLKFIPAAIITAVFIASFGCEMHPPQTVEEHAEKAGEKKTDKEKKAVAPEHGTPQTPSFFQSPKDH